MAAGLGGGHGLFSVKEIELANGTGSLGGLVAVAETMFGCVGSKVTTTIVGKCLPNSNMSTCLAFQT